MYPLHVCWIHLHNDEDLIKIGTKFGAECNQAMMNCKSILLCRRKDIQCISLNNDDKMAHRYCVNKKTLQFNIDNDLLPMLATIPNGGRSKLVCELLRQYFAGIPIKGDSGTEDLDARLALLETLAVQPQNHAAVTVKLQTRDINRGPFLLINPLYPVGSMNGTTVYEVLQVPHGLSLLEVVSAFGAVPLMERRKRFSFVWAELFAWNEERKKIEAANNARNLEASNEADDGDDE